MNDSPLCVDANLVIRLVADPGDERGRSTRKQRAADHRLARAVHGDLPWVHMLDVTE
jgi:hypothetical protein